MALNSLPAAPDVHGISFITFFFSNHTHTSSKGTKDWACPPQKKDANNTRIGNLKIVSPSSDHYKIIGGWLNGIADNCFRVSHLNNNCIAGRVWSVGTRVAYFNCSPPVTSRQLEIVGLHIFELNHQFPSQAHCSEQLALARRPVLGKDHGRIIKESSILRGLWKEAG